MTDTTRPPTPAHPRGMIGAVQEQMFGPPADPDPEHLAAEARQAHRDELRDAIEVAQRFAVLVGLVAMELLVAVLLLGVIFAIY